MFSVHSRDSRWVEAEVSSLIYDRIQGSKSLIPVKINDDAWVPPLMRPLAWRRIDEIDAIADAVLGRQPAAPPVAATAWGRAKRVLISLQPDGKPGEVRAEVQIGDQVFGDAEPQSLPGVLRRALADYLRGFRLGLRRSPDAAARASLESAVADLGRHLRELCLPGESGTALAKLLDTCPIGELVEILFQADGAELLGLPFEALRLPDDRL